MKISKNIIRLFAITSIMAGCMKNKDITYPDFAYSTVYFGTQYPVRTVELGEDLFVDNSLDNQHTVSIKATIGGVQNNTKEVKVNVSVDTALCNQLYFSSTGRKIIPLPAKYYSLGSSQLIIPSGSILGGIEVHLTNAFFDDSLAISNNYALPLLMNSISGADSILRGKAAVANPNRCIDANWTVKPRDFVIYVLKYVNAYHGNYLRRGKDIITGSVDTTQIRHQQYVEKDEVNKLSTKSLKAVQLPIVFKNSSNANVSVVLVLTFDDNGNCTITSGTTGIVATGTGRFVSKGEKNSWGNSDRDAIYLNYSVDIPKDTLQIQSIDTLVLRDRSVSAETFTPFIKG